jgi:hypothetical protein
MIKNKSNNNIHADEYVEQTDIDQWKLNNLRWVSFPHSSHYDITHPSLVMKLGECVVRHSRGYISSRKNVIISSQCKVHARKLRYACRTSTSRKPSSNVEVIGMKRRFFKAPIFVVRNGYPTYMGP